MFFMAEKLSRASLDEKVLLAAIMAAAKCLMKADHCDIFLVDEIQQAMTSCFENGQRITIPEEAGIARHTRERGRPVQQGC